MSLISQSLGAAILNPKPILDMDYAFAQMALLIAVVHLHIFTYLPSDPLTAASLAALVKTELGPITKLLEGLRTLGLVEREGNLYRLSPLADRSSSRGKAQ